MKAPLQTVRLFLAVPPCQEIYVASRDLRNLNAGLTGTKWIGNDNLHLTVFFIGDVNSGDVNDMMDLLPDALRLISNPVRLNFQSFTLEGDRQGRPSMVWARFQESNDFSDLVNRIYQLLSPLLPQEPRFKKPVPHVTLGRIRSGATPCLDVSMQASVTIHGFELWETVRSESGVTYRVKGKYYHPEV
jgi:2'-5' RNA ligase